MEGWEEKKRTKEGENERLERLEAGINFVRVNRIFGGRERRSPIVRILCSQVSPPAHLLFKEQADCERVNSNLLER